MESTMQNSNCDFEAKYPARVKAVDRGNKSIIMTKSMQGSSFKKKSYKLDSSTLIRPNTVNNDKLRSTNNEKKAHKNLTSDKLQDLAVK